MSKSTQSLMLKFGLQWKDLIRVKVKVKRLTQKEISRKRTTNQRDLDPVRLKLLKSPEGKWNLKTSKPTIVTKKRIPTSPKKEVKKNPFPDLEMKRVNTKVTKAKTAPKAPAVSGGYNFVYTKAGIKTAPEPKKVEKTSKEVIKAMKPEIPSKPARKSVFCQRCPESFAAREDFDIHLIKVHYLDIILPPEQFEDSVDKECEFVNCDEVFRCRSLLGEHLAQKHNIVNVYFDQIIENDLWKER